ncbi:hypothetical protein BC830DRAFT_1168680 [Chytriomyces sp. MP71]|nr:hypothetical protein BC830DRAFT_1168680 [Chytriomyces sp. MP71]
MRAHALRASPGAHADAAARDSPPRLGCYAPDARCDEKRRLPMHRPTKMQEKERKRRETEAEPQTFDALVEAAMESEEKGDRYKDGEKARRFYEAACEAYLKASSLKQNDAACEYNLGRLLLLLAEFKAPAYSASQRRSLLKDSVSRLRGAVQLDEFKNAESLFNLAQALRARFEDALDDGNAGESSFQELVEADRALEAVLAIQVAELTRTREIASREGECEPGCTDYPHSHSHQHHEEDNEDTGMDESTDDAEADYELATEATPVTNETIIETLVAHASLLTLAATSLSNISPPESDTAFHRAAAKLDATQPHWLPTTIEPADVSLARANLLTSRAEAIFETSPKTEAASAPWRALFEEASVLYDAILTSHPACAEAPADKGDMLTTYADCLLTCTIGSPGAPGFETLAARVAQETSAGGSSSQTQELPATSLLVALRQMLAAAASAYKTAHQIEPSKASVSARLGDLEATRTNLYTQDPKTQQVLLANAATHYNRALATLGVNMSLLSTQKGTADDEAARSALLGLAKVCSHFDGRGAECKSALVCWKRRGGDMGDSESAIYFHEKVFGEEWFGKLMG